MKTNRIAIVALVVCRLSFAAHDALAFYNPSTGRWLSRDPAGETGFQILRRNKTGNIKLHAKPIASKVCRRNNARVMEVAYSFNANNGVSKVDVLGLRVMGSTCEPEQVEKFTASMNKMCRLALSPKLRCCTFSPELLRTLRKVCNGQAFDLVLLCVGAENENCRGGMCAGVSADADWDKDGSGILYLCPSAWGQKPCDTTFDCMVLHELMHGAGLKGGPNTDTQRVEKCLGCKESYKH